jgi:hypothetical protein
VSISPLCCIARPHSSYRLHALVDSLCKEPLGALAQLEQFGQQHAPNLFYADLRVELVG